MVVDHFHVVQLANKMLSLVRRRTTAEIRGRRGRAADPEWKARRRLLRNREDLTDEQFAKMWNPLLDEGKIGQILLTAWIAKENLRTLLALARTGADRHQVGHARWKFLTWCADSDIPEVRTLAATVDRWWPEIDAFIDTGHSNAKSEGHQPRDQARRPQRVRVPQRRQPASTDTLRHHTTSPRTPPHRLTSKTHLVADIDVLDLLSFAVGHQHSGVRREAVALLGHRLRCVRGLLALPPALEGVPAAFRRAR